MAQIELIDVTLRQPHRGRISFDLYDPNGAGVRIRWTPLGPDDLICTSGGTWSCRTSPCSGSNIEAVDGTNPTGREHVFSFPRARLLSLANSHAGTHGHSYYMTMEFCPVSPGEDPAHPSIWYKFVVQCFADPPEAAASISYPTETAVYNSTVDPSSLSDPATVYLGVTPKQGWRFKRWRSKTTTWSTTANPVTLHLTYQSAWIYPNFTVSFQYVAEFEAVGVKARVAQGNGTVDPVYQEPAVGESYTLTATPGEHSTFLYWQSSEGDTRTTNVITEVFARPISWEAHFEGYALAIKTCPTGVGTVTASMPVALGETYDIATAPADIPTVAGMRRDYEFVCWAFDDGINPIAVVSCDPEFAITIPETAPTSGVFRLYAIYRARRHYGVWTDAQSYVIVGGSAALAQDAAGGLYETDTVSIAARPFPLRRFCGFYSALPGNQGEIQRLNGRTCFGSKAPNEGGEA